MHRKLSWLLVVGFALALILSLAQSPAEAIPPFQKEFVKMYAPPGSPLAAKVKKVKCNICHKGKKKKNRNAYGDALAKLQRVLNIARTSGAKLQYLEGSETIERTLDGLASYEASKLYPDQGLIQVRLRLLPTGPYWSSTVRGSLVWVW